MAGEEKRHTDHGLGNSLAVQWLGLGIFTAVAQARTLAGELRILQAGGAAKKKKKDNGFIHVQWNSHHTPLPQPHGVQRQRGTVVKSYVWPGQFP